MKWKKFLPAIVTGVLVLAVVVHMLIYVIAAFSSPLATAEAITYTAEETLTISGYFARDEQVIESEILDNMELLVGEGAKVARGQAISVSYDSASARAAASELAEVEARIAQLEAVSGGVSYADIPKLDGAISEQIYAAIQTVQTGEVASLTSTRGQLEELLLERRFSSSESVGAVQAAIDELRLRGDTLRAGISGTSASVHAPVAGYFSGTVDGYESVLNLERTKTITVAELKALDQSAAPPAGRYGKLMTDFEWRLVAAIPVDYAARLEQGSTVRLRFSDDYAGEVSARVQRIGEEENGECVLVLSCTMLFSELAPLRRQTVDIVLSVYEGVRVPKEAVRLDENGETGVYRMVAKQADFVKIERIYEMEHHYIVAYHSADFRGLRPGDEIIVSAKSLYDGKIIS